MVEDTGAIEDDLREEVVRLQDSIVKVRALVDQSIRCPITGNVMEDPVPYLVMMPVMIDSCKALQASYDSKGNLQQSAMKDNSSVIPPVSTFNGGSGPPVMEALSCSTGTISPLEYTMETDEDAEAGAPLRTSERVEKVGFVSQMLRSINSISSGSKRSGETCLWQVIHLDFFDTDGSSSDDSKTS
eukprot:755899-Hanusia_phi.AAC.3